MNGISKENPAIGRMAGQGMNGEASRHLYYTQDGKVAATLEHGVLKKRVRSSVHMLRKPPGWAVDLAILEAARRDGAVQVQITDVETRRRYTAPLVAFDLCGVRFNRGFGDQIALPLAHWQVESADARQLALPEV